MSYSVIYLWEHIGNSVWCQLNEGQEKPFCWPVEESEALSYSPTKSKTKACGHRPLSCGVTSHGSPLVSSHKVTVASVPLQFYLRNQQQGQAVTHTTAAEPYLQVLKERSWVDCFVPKMEFIVNINSTQFSVLVYLLGELTFAVEFQRHLVLCAHSGEIICGFLLLGEWQREFGYHP